MPTKLLIVPRCSACPFFEDDPVKVLGGIFTQALLSDSLNGLCNILPSGEFLPSTDLKLGLPSGPSRETEELRFAKARTRRRIDDKQTIPEDCPLRRSDWTITTALGN